MAPRTSFVVCGFVVFLIAALPARADPIRVEFTVFAAPSDPVNTAPSTGFFTFDDSLIPSGGGLVQNFSGLGATDINFAWSHTLFTTANADLVELRFSPSGRLLDFFLGGFSGGITGFLTGPPEAVVDDFAIVSSQASSGAGFQYTNAGNPEILFGGLKTSLEPVPEPSSFVLLGTAAVILLSRRTWRGIAAGASIGY